ncbi:hypothetical protein LIER_20050 [Lithospermum erythrorhizon]|uniref:Regulator of Vps4 activity in the MVB pathway protein n=1 Tax=Lithospermum erythrorhizon TaxID=34254 RepID=A0AAV3QK56_LITER
MVSMGKKLDALLGRGFKCNKFKATVNLAISRLAILRNQHQARCSVARSDVVQILNLGQHEGALLRVEQVVKEQNMLDVYTMIEIYCYLLIQRVSLLEHAKECPEELKEAISSLIYACSRCGEFPELHEIRAIFTSRFGKEFVARAAQLRNNCGVNPKMIQKLSTRMPTVESRLKVLKEIALENSIVLEIEEPDSVQSKVKKEAENKQDDSPNQSNELADSEPLVDKPDVTMTDGLSDSVKMRRKYKDVAQAAQAAFESAAYAAVAARAAVELSRTDSHDPDSPRTPSARPDKLADSPERIKKSEREYLFERSLSDSSVESENNTLVKTEEFSDDEEIMPQRRNTVMFDDTDSETEDRGRVLSFGNHASEPGNRYSLQSNESIISQKFDQNENEIVQEKEYSVADIKNQEQKFDEGKMHNNLSINRAPISVRTRRTYPR